MPEMDSTTSKANMDAMDIDVGFDASNNSKRVKRSSAGNDSVELSAREDDLVTEIDASSTDLGMRAWKPMNGHRGKLANGNGANLIWKPKSPSSFTSNSLEKGYLIRAQRSVGNENGKNEVIIFPDVGTTFPFQRSDVGIKGKEVESNGYHRQNFPVMEPSISNRSIMRQPDGIASSSKKDKEVYSYIDLSEGVSSHELNSNLMHSGEKGKLNLDFDTPKDMRHGEPTVQSSRAASLFGKEVVTIAEEQGSCFESYQNLGRRKAHDSKINMNQLSHAYPSNYKQKLSSSYVPEWRQETDHANVISKGPQVSTQNHISNPHHDQAFPNAEVRRWNHGWNKHVKGKSECNSLLSNYGKTSGSILHQPSYPQSRAGVSNLKLDKSNKNRCHGTTLIEIDKLYPEAICCNSHGQQTGVSDSQIESDEIFARQLQEQFYHETTRFIDMEKVDATIAWSLQQDEDAKDTALTWRDHPNSVFFDEIRSNYNSEVDLERRLDLLEAMEDLLEDSDMLEYDIDLPSNHSFNDTDYLMQSGDESNHQHFNSSVINNLPLSLIQNNNNKEACAVCLEIPSVGETMRHLPCLHKFHKMCIDTWLRRKPSCPVCKFNIT